MCIQIDLVCNGENDCGQWEDEPDTCSDVCARNNGGCSHVCIATTTGVKCTCHEGYTPDPRDQRRCKANEGKAELIFTRKTSIRRFSFESQEEATIIKETRSSMALDFHFESGMIFWSDLFDHCIYKASISEGGNMTTAVKNDAKVNSDGLAVDWIYRHLYWTDFERNTIEMADFDGNMRKTIVSRLQQPRAIAFDPLQGWLYWSSWGGSPMIERSGMDGSHRQVLVKSQIKWPNGIVLDHAEKRLYWIDGKMSVICSINYDGSDRHTIFSDRQWVGHGFSLTVFEDWLYWSDWESEERRIVRFNKNKLGNAGDAFVIQKMPDNPMTVQVYHPYRQPTGPNHCGSENGRCSHLCLPAPQIHNTSAKFLCACPDGSSLAPDARTCVQGGAELSTTTEFTNSTVNVPRQNDGINGFVIGLICAVVVVTIILVSCLIYRHIQRKNASRRMNY